MIGHEHYAIVAQVVEQMPCKHPVVGSNPINGSGGLA